MEATRAALREEAAAAKSKTAEKAALKAQKAALRAAVGCAEMAVVPETYPGQLPPRAPENPHQQSSPRARCRRRRASNAASRPPALLPHVHLLTDACIVCELRHGVVTDGTTGGGTTGGGATGGGATGGRCDGRRRRDRQRRDRQRRDRHHTHVARPLQPALSHSPACASTPYSRSTLTATLTLTPWHAHPHPHATCSPSHAHALLALTLALTVHRRMWYHSHGRWLARYPHCLYISVDSCIHSGVPLKIPVPQTFGRQNHTSGRWRGRAPVRPRARRTASKKTSPGRREAFQL